MISVEEALERVLAAVAPLGEEQLLLDAAAGHVLAVPVVAARALPPWDNSAMDGYAVRASDAALATGDDTPGLPVVATVAAGHSPAPLEAGTAVRIMTGAPLPRGADAIVMKEDAHEQDGRVRFTKAPGPQAHVRRAGDDIAHGDTALAAGTLLGPGEIGLAAALGRTVLVVHRRPRVAILSTGDELVAPDRAPGPGQIVGSNAWALAAQCREAGAIPVVLPFAADTPDAIRAAFTSALRCDAVVSSGGVSVGEFDHVRDVLDSLGVKQEFWRVAMKPGKPVAFATRGEVPIFALPGNPASSMVGFELFVRPALRRLQGMSGDALLRPRAPVLLDTALRHDGGRRHFARARVRRDGVVLHASPQSRQGSGMLRSMVGINALLDVPGDAGALEPGSTLDAILLAPL